MAIAEMTVRVADLPYVERIIVAAAEVARAWRRGLVIGPPDQMNELQAALLGSQKPGVTPAAYSTRGPRNLRGGDTISHWVKRVLLDGQDVAMKDCLEVDADEGYVVLLKVDDDGHHYVDYSAGEPAQERRYGTVEVIF